jgi:hypothetical protein
MNANRWMVLAALGPLLCASWLLMTAAWPRGPAGPPQYLFIGYLLGTMFGPAPRWLRLPLSLGWVAVLLLALLASLVINGGYNNDWQILLFMGVCLAGQWLLIHGLLWGLAIGYGIHIRHRDDDAAVKAGSRQFGIRQLMVLTAIVAVALGAGRGVILATATALQGRNSSEFAVFAFLTAAGIVITLPLLAAALVPRWAWQASMIVLGLIAVATWWELPLVRTAGGGPDLWHLILINAFQTGWVLVIVIVVRMCGYGIVQPASVPCASSRSGGGLGPR